MAKSPESERNGVLLTIAGGTVTGAVLLFVWATFFSGMHPDSSFFSGYRNIATGIGMCVGGSIGAAITLTTAWSRYLASRIGLAYVGRLPWRLTYFLDDARRRGILRRVGVTYEFRDRRLAEVLEGDYRRR